MLAFPGTIELHQALAGEVPGALSNDRRWLLADTNPGHVDQTFTLPAWDGGAPSVVLLWKGRVAALYHPAGITCSPTRGHHTSRFLPPSLNWTQTAEDVPSGHKRKRTAQVKEIPEFDVTRVVRRAHVWRQRIPDLGAAARVILEGRLALPLASADVEPVDQPNLPTCFGDAEPVLDAIVSEYLVTGVLEYCGPGCEPSCFSPLGMVPKRTAPFHRLIIDMRRVNRYCAVWRSKMSGMAASAMMFNPGAVAFARDLKAAYLNQPLGGCGGGVQSEPKRMKAPGHRRYWVGCTPDNCTGTCSKSLFGIRWRGVSLRYAAPTFGSRHGCNILDLLARPLFRKIKRLGADVISWVDDGLMIVRNTDDPHHDPRSCGGRTGCHHCRETFERAEKVELLVDEEIAALGFLTSPKSAPPAQAGHFLGIDWDTVRGAYVLSAEKATSLASKAAELLECGSVTPRDCAKFKGKLQWYSCCVEGVTILTRQLNRFVGSPDDEQSWDRPRPLPSEARDELSFWAENLPHMASVAKPMWYISPSELLRRYQAGLPSVDAVLSTDASWMGYGAVLQLGPRAEATVTCTSGRWAPHDHAAEQAHREMVGTRKSFETFAPDLAGKTVLHLTDCTPVAFAVGRGSKASAVLQDEAVLLWRLAARWGFHMASVWVPGAEMVDNNVDYLSREGTVDAHAVRSHDVAWGHALALTTRCSMQLDVDLFADGDLARLPRFWSLLPAPGAEGVDALSATSWGPSNCDRCDARHNQGLWLFPPPPLLGKVLAKARGDRAHGVALVPVRPDATWWGLLRDATISNGVVELAAADAVCVPPPQPGAAHRHQPYTATSWHLVAFNFSGHPLTDTPAAEQCSKPLRSEPPSISPDALEHRKYLQALLAFHPAPQPPSASSTTQATPSASTSGRRATT